MLRREGAGHGLAEQAVLGHREDYRGWMAIGGTHVAGRLGVLYPSMRFSKCYERTEYALALQCEPH